LSDQIERDEIGGECSTYGESKVYIGFWWGKLRESDHLEDPGINERIILRWIFRKWNVGHGQERAGSE